MLLKKLRQLRDNLTHIKIDSTPKVKDVKIEINYNDNFIIFDITDDCSSEEYQKALEKYDQKNISNKLSYCTLCEGSFNAIKRKRIYICSQDNILYNIYFNENTIHINERIKQEQPKEKCFIDERIIEIDKTNNNIKINRLKHDKNYSTYYVKCYSTKEDIFESFTLDKDDALALAKEAINNLSQVRNIENIINLSEINSYLNIKNQQPIQYTK